REYLRKLEGPVEEAVLLRELGHGLRGERRRLAATLAQLAPRVVRRRRGRDLARILRPHECGAPRVRDELLAPVLRRGPLVAPLERARVLRGVALDQRPG